jgi:pimeloyl-ACP methyl ester carboxylesterase
MPNSSRNPPPSSLSDPNKLALGPEERKSLHLLDGRTLGYATYGSTKRSDPAIFLFHGMPGCRLVGRSWNKLCKDIDARLITIDRPGNGLSTLSDRTLIQWPEDVLSVADHLKLSHFSIVGGSAGGPFALACARFIPKERLRATTVVCGIAPIEAFLDTMPYLSWRWGGFTPWAVKLAARYIILPRLLAPYRDLDPARLKHALEDQCQTPEEREFLTPDPSRETDLDDAVAGLLETFRQGDGGFMLDGSITCRDWGFDLEDIEGERVWLWHGDQDAVAPVATARWMDERLGGGRLRVLEGGTHSTIWKHHEKEIFMQSAGA